MNVRHLAPKQSIDADQLNMGVSLLEELASIESQRSAFEALKESPLTFPALRQLCAALMIGDWLEKDSLDETLAFIRAKKLPTGKIVKWLSKQGIQTDREIILRLWIPLLAQMGPMYQRMAEQQG